MPSHTVGALALHVVILVCLIRHGYCQAIQTARHRKLSMMLFLSNETLPHDKPLVTDPLAVPPWHPLEPLTASELSKIPTHEYIGMCLVANDRVEYVREWMEHYLMLGVGRIYMYHHVSSPNSTMFSDLITAGKVVYQLVPDPDGPWRQFAVYEDCLKNYRLRHHWITFYDADEFLLLKKRSIRDLPSYLKSFEPYGGLVVNWRVVGSSGHMFRPRGSVVDAYTRCTLKDHAINEHVKTIVNTKYVCGHADNPHAFLYQEGYHAVNEKKQRVDSESLEAHNGAITPGCISTDNVVLFHYGLKSVEDYQDKVTRGSINRTPYKSYQKFQEMDSWCTDVCTEAVDHKAFRMRSQKG